MKNLIKCWGATMTAKPVYKKVFFSIYIGLCALLLTGHSYSMEVEPIGPDIIDVLVTDTCEGLEGANISCLWGNSSCQAVMMRVYSQCNSLVNEALEGGTAQGEAFRNTLKECQERHLYEHLQSQGRGPDDICS